VEIGWKLLREEGPRPGFLRIGVTTAVLKAEGTIPRDNEELKRLVR